MSNENTTMDTTARRYIAPAQPPRLSSSKPAPRASAGVICFHSAEGRQAPRLVTFDWGRVVSSRRGR